VSATFGVDADELVGEAGVAVTAAAAGAAIG